MSAITQPYSAIKRSILAFVKNLVSKSVYKSIEFVLNPCCEVTISDIDFTCTATGVATIDITLADGVSFPKSGTATLSSSDTSGFSKTVAYTTNDATLQFTLFKIQSGATDVVYTLTLKFPTNTDLTQGFYKSDTITTDNPTCA